MTVPASEISVVVQGPVNGKPDDPPHLRLTADCLASVRRHLPGAEVILSTWQGSDVRNLDFDVLVESPDPGAVSHWRDSNWLFNLNRQIRSSMAGLRKATRPNAVKIRSDMRIDNLGFLSLYDRFPARCAEWQVFSRRVVACTTISQNVRRWGLVYCPSDWFHFGRTDDVRKLWDVPEDKGDAVALYFTTHPRPVPDKNPPSLCRYAVEQYIWLQCLNKHAPVECTHLWDNREANKRLTELTFANNLILADEARLGVVFCKYRQARLHRLLSYTHGEWLGLYKRYCDPAFRGANRPRAWWDGASRRGQLLMGRLWYRAQGLFRRIAGGNKS